MSATTAASLGLLAAAEDRAERIAEAASRRVVSAPWRLGRGWPFAALHLAPIVTGLAYVTIQWRLTSTVQDEWFIGMLCGATVLLLQGVRATHSFIACHAVGFFAYCQPDDTVDHWLENARAFQASIFLDSRMLWTGAIYGSALALSPFVLGVWRDDSSLAAVLSVFMFTVNFATGIAFYGLGRFFVEVWKLRDTVRVSIWSRHNLSTDFLDAIRSRAALLTATYVAACLSSVLVSVLPVGDLILAYSFFACLSILAAHALPGILIRARIAERKRDSLIAIDEQLDEEFRRTISGVRTRDERLDLTRFETLLTLRSRVSDRSAWPFGWRSLRTGAGIVVVTALPVVLDYLLGRF